MQTVIKVECGRICIAGPYSEPNNDHWGSLGGLWTGGHWSLPDNDNARKLVAELFGTRSDEVDVIIPAERLDDGPIIQIGGYVIAERRHRDRSVKMFSGASLEAGKFCASCGSYARPRVGLDDEMVFKLRCRRSFAEANGLEIVEPSDEPPPAIDI